jgi:hypothetical protein
MKFNLIFLSKIKDITSSTYAISFEILLIILPTGVFSKNSNLENINFVFNYRNIL